MPDPVDELYGLPLDEFTAARNALAKELSRQGDKAKAADVKKLPKPNRTAWALNQLARQQPEEVTTLLAVGEQLREAQQRALSGDASQLRTASRAEQEQINRLVDAVLAIAPGLQQDPVRATLRAAAADPATGAILRAGRLVSDVETAGFGLDGLPEELVIEPPAAPARTEKRRKDNDKEEAARREAERQARREARKEAERLRREAELALRRAQRLRQEAEEAEERALQARRDAEAAAAAAEEAQRLAEEAAGRLTPDL